MLFSRSLPRPSSKVSVRQCGAAWCSVEPNAAWNLTHLPNTVSGWHWHFKILLFFSGTANLTWDVKEETQRPAAERNSYWSPFLSICTERDESLRTIRSKEPVRPVLFSLYASPFLATLVKPAVPPNGKTQRCRHGGFCLLVRTRCNSAWKGSVDYNGITPVGVYLV